MMNDRKSVGFPYRIVLYILFTLGIIFLGAGIWLNVDWVKHGPSWKLYVLNMLPGLVFLAIWFVGKKIHKWGWFVIGLGVSIAVVLSGFVATCNIGAFLWSEATTPVTDPVCYESALERYNYPETEWIGHFPARIPVNATNVHFYHLQAFLQGGMILQLRCVLPSEEIESLLTESVDKAKQVRETDGGYLGSSGPDDLRIPRLCAGEKDYVHWPKGYKIIVYNAEDRSGGSWNHGFSYGVAISMARNEVIYWAEDW